MGGGGREVWKVVAVGRKLVELGRGNIGNGGLGGCCWGRGCEWSVGGGGGEESSGCSEGCCRYDQYSFCLLSSVCVCVCYRSYSNYFLHCFIIMYFLKIVTCTFFKL